MIRDLRKQQIRKQRPSTPSYAYGRISLQLTKCWKIIRSAIPNKQTNYHQIWVVYCCYSNLIKHFGLGYLMASDALCERLSSKLGAWNSIRVSSYKRPSAIDIYQATATSSSAKHPPIMDIVWCDNARSSALLPAVKVQAGPKCQIATMNRSDANRKGYTADHMCTGKIPTWVCCVLTIQPVVRIKKSWLVTTRLLHKTEVQYFFSMICVRNPPWLIPIRYVCAQANMNERFWAYPLYVIVRRMWLTGTLLVLFNMYE
jgi:hypothetical protein